MAKWANDACMDAMLNYIADESDRLFLCSDFPANYTEANATANYNLGTATITPGDGNGQFTVGDGDANGRKVNVALTNIASIAANGTANHVVLGNSTNTVIHYATTCANQAVTVGNPANVANWDIEVADPS